MKPNLPIWICFMFADGLFTSGAEVIKQSAEIGTRADTSVKPNNTLTCSLFACQNQVCRKSDNLYYSKAVACDDEGRCICPARQQGNGTPKEGCTAVRLTKDKYCKGSTKNNYYQKFGPIYYVEYCPGLDDDRKPGMFCQVRPRTGSNTGGEVDCNYKDSCIKAQRKADQDALKALSTRTSITKCTSAEFCVKYICDDPKFSSHVLCDAKGQCVCPIGVGPLPNCVKPDASTPCAKKDTAGSYIVSKRYHCELILKNKPAGTYCVYIGLPYKEPIRQYETNGLCTQATCGDAICGGVKHSAGLGTGCRRKACFCENGVKAKGCQPTPDEVLFRDCYRTETNSYICPRISTTDLECALSEKPFECRSSGSPCTIDQQCCGCCSSHDRKCGNFLSCAAG